MRIFIFALLIITGTSMAADTTQTAMLKRLFEWGAYDSLLLQTHPVNFDAATFDDSCLLATVLTYRGVALCASDSLEAGRNAFRAAYRFNPTVRLETFYVSPEIAALFTSAIEECRKSVLADSLDLVQLVLKDRNRQVMDSVRVAERRRSGIGLAASSFALAGACAGVAVYQYFWTERIYTDFRRAAAEGDRPAYDRLKNQVAQGDLVMLLTCAGAALLGGSGLYFTVTIPSFSPKNQTVSIFPMEKFSAYGFVLAASF